MTKKQLEQVSQLPEGERFVFAFNDYEGNISVGSKDRKGLFHYYAVSFDSNDNAIITPEER